MPIPLGSYKSTGLEKSRLSFEKGRKTALGITEGVVGAGMSNALQTLEQIQRSQPSRQPAQAQQPRNVLEMAQRRGYGQQRQPRTASPSATPTPDPAATARFDARLDFLRENGLPVDELDPQQRQIVSEAPDELIQQAVSENNLGVFMEQGRPSVQRKGPPIARQFLASGEPGVAGGPFQLGELAALPVGLTTGLGSALARRGAMAAAGRATVNPALRQALVSGGEHTLGSVGTRAVTSALGAELAARGTAHGLEEAGIDSPYLTLPLTLGAGIAGGGLGYAGGSAVQSGAGAAAERIARNLQMARKHPGWSERGGTRYTPQEEGGVTPDELAFGKEPTAEGMMPGVLESTDRDLPFKTLPPEKAYRPAPQGHFEQLRAQRNLLESLHNRKRQESHTYLDKKKRIPQRLWREIDDLSDKIRTIDQTLESTRGIERQMRIEAGKAEADMPFPSPEAERVRFLLNKRIREVNAAGGDPETDSQVKYLREQHSKLYEEILPSRPKYNLSGDSESDELTYPTGSAHIEDVEDLGLPGTRGMSQPQMGGAGETQFTRERAPGKPGYTPARPEPRPAAVADWEDNDLARAQAQLQNALVSPLDPPVREFLQEDLTRIEQEIARRGVDYQPGTGLGRTHGVSSDWFPEEKGLGPGTPQGPHRGIEETGIPGEVGDIPGLGSLQGDHYRSFVAELDSRNAPDSDYAAILSTGSKSKGKETWRSKVLRYADMADERQGLGPGTFAGESLEQGVPGTVPDIEEAVPFTGNVSEAFAQDLPQADIFRGVLEGRIKATPEQTAPDTLLRDLKRSVAAEQARQEPNAVNTDAIADLAKVEGPEGTRAVAAMDPRILKVLGGNLYTGDLQQISMKEMIQNAVDAVRPQGGAGKVRIDWDADEKTLMVTDNGIGMTPETAMKEFVDIGGSLKVGEGASGGFGVAKVAIFSNAESIEVVTQHKGVKTKLTGSGDDWLDSERGLKVVTENITDKRGGTGIRIKLKPDIRTSRYTVDTWVRNFQTTNRLPFKVTFNGSSLPKMQVEPIHTESVRGAVMEYFAPEQTTKTSYVQVHVLNNGLPQFSKTVYLQRDLDAPQQIVLDVKANKGPEHPDYPFTPSREQLRQDADFAVETFVKNNIGAAAARRETDTILGSIDSAPRTTTGFRIVDTSGKMRKTYAQSLSKENYIQDLVEHAEANHQRIWEAAVQHYPNIEQVQFSGIGLGTDYLGINIRMNTFRPNDPDMILLNPFMIWREVEQATLLGYSLESQRIGFMARRIASTQIHEVAHSIARGHGEEFSSVLTRLMDITAPFFMDMADRVEAVIARHQTAFDRGAQSYASESAIGAGINLVGRASDSAKPTGADSRGGQGVPGPNEKAGDASQVPPAAGTETPQGGGARVAARRGARGVVTPGDAPNPSNAPSPSNAPAFGPPVKPPNKPPAPPTGGPDPVPESDPLKNITGVVKTGKGRVTTEDMVDLFNRISDNKKLSPEEKSTTGAALTAILTGKRPTTSEIRLIRRAFGPELSKALAARKSWQANVWENFVGAANFPRAVMSSWDASAPLRQAVVLTIAHPHQSLPAGWKMLQAFKSDKALESVYQAIEDSPYAVYKKQLYITPRDGNLGDREEAFMSAIAERWVPGVRASQRAYLTYLNKLRSDVFDMVAKNWEGTGKRQADYDSLALWINHASGRGTLGKFEGAAPLLNAIFFSPRLLVSRFQMGSDVLSSTSAARGMVIRDLSIFVGTGITILTLLKESGVADVNLDPRNPDFGKVKMGNQRFDFWGGYQQIARYSAQLAAGVYTGDMKPLEVVGRFVRSKAAPTTGLAIDILEGKTFLGEELKPTTGGISEQALARLTPLFIQDMRESIQEEGFIGGVRGMVGAFGVTVDAYQPKVTTQLFDIPQYRGLTVDMQRDILGTRNKKGFMDRVRDSRRDIVDVQGKEALDTKPQPQSIVEQGLAEGKSKEFIAWALILNQDSEAVKRLNPEWLNFIYDNKEALEQEVPDIFSIQLEDILNRMELAHQQKAVGQ